MVEGHDGAEPLGAHGREQLANDVAPRPHLECVEVRHVRPPHCEPVRVLGHWPRILRAGAAVERGPGRRRKVGGREASGEIFVADVVELAERRDVV